MQFGIAHVGPDYWHVRGTGSLIEDGADDVKTIGSDAIKLFAGPTYASALYDLEVGWSDVATTLDECIALSEYWNVLDDSGFTTVAIDFWTFAGFNAEQWRTPDSLWDDRMAEEYQEVYDTAVYILTNASNATRYILQNWEGDWQLLGNTTVSTFIPHYRIRSCRAYHQVHQQAIEDARRAVTNANGATVSYAVEVNRVRDTFEDQSPGYIRLVNKILPTIRPDIVSYSHYDTINQYGGSQSEHEAWMAVNIPAAWAAIRRACPNSELVVGEVGWQEKGAGFPAWGDAADMLDYFLGLVDADGDIDLVQMWQMWDNSGGGEICCIDSLDALTDQGTYINTLLGGGF